MTLLVAGIMSIRPMAANTVISQITRQFPNSQGAWSNQFYLARSTNVTFEFSILDNYNSVLINNGMQYFITDMNKKSNPYTLYISNKNALNYSMTVTLPAGTYQFGAYNSSGQYFRLRFKISIDGGINAQDKVSVMEGKTATVEVSSTTGTGGSVVIRPGYPYTWSENTYIATVAISGSSVKITGVSMGKTIVHVTATDGSTDTIEVTVTKKVPEPALTYTTLKMKAGEKIKNAVSNASGQVYWRTTKSSVAKVNGKGKITAVGYGTAYIHATGKDGAGRAFDIKCKVKVARTLPDYQARITRVSENGKTIKVKIKNLSKVALIVNNKKAYAKPFTTETGLVKRNLKLKSGSQVTIPAGKTKTVTFATKKGKLKADKEAYEVRFMFTEDKLKYYGLCDLYIPNSRYRETDDENYIPSYSTWEP